MNNRPISQLKMSFLLLIFLALPALACGVKFNPDALFGGSDEEDARATAEAVEVDVSEAVADAQSQAATAAAAAMEDASEAGTAAAQAAADAQQSAADAAATAEAIAQAATNSNEQTDSQSPSGGAMTSEDREKLFEAMRTAFSVDAIRFSLTVEDKANNFTTSTILEIIRPDRFHLVSEGVELIIVGDKTYLQQGGSWIESPVGMEAMIEPFSAMISPEFIESNIESMEMTLGELSFKGNESVNGVDTEVYEFTSSESVTNLTTRSTIWIGSEDGRVYRQVIVNENPPQANNITTIEYAYGEDVVIEAPIP